MSRRQDWPGPGLHRGGGRPRDALVEVMVHGQDIARPLGLERPMDPVLAELAGYGSGLFQRAFTRLA